MKKNIYIFSTFLFLNFGVLAQQPLDKTQKFESKMSDLLKEDKELMFQTNKVPDAFKDESIIVLAEKVKISFYGKASLTSSLTYVHKKILLNDIAALEAFSEYTFDKPNGANAMQLNVIKTDGSVIKVDLKDAVKDEKKLKIRSYNFSFSEEKQKIALKNLEVGDVLEYVGLFDKWQGNYQSTFYLASEYSIVASKIIYEVEKDNFYVAYKSINNCPQFKTNKVSNVITYTLEDTMRSSYEEELEDITAYTEPHFKIHVIPSYMVKNFAFKYQIGKAKTAVTEIDLKQEVLKEMKLLTGSSSEYYIDYIEQYGYRQTDAEFLKTYFYYLRNRIYTETVTFDTKPQSFGLSLMNKMIRGAQKRKIQYEIVLLKDKDEGRFDDILFEDELYWGVIFKTAEADVSFYSFHLFAHPNEMPSDFEGTEAYRLKVGSTIAKTTIEKYQIPVTQNTHNTYLTKMNASFSGGIDSLKVNQHVVLKGYYRNNTKFDLLNRYDYFNLFLKQLKEEKVLNDTNLHFYFITNKAYLNYDETFIKSEEIRGRELFKKNQNDRLKRYFENGHKSESYTLLKYNQYQILSDSKSPDSNWLEWREDLVIGDVATKIDDKLMVLEVGKIFSGMYQINNDKNREVRSKPFVIKFNRAFTTELALTIPEGYKIKDVSQLNRLFENSTGKFSTVASIQGNTLNIILNKEYKANTYAKETWPEYISFLDAAAGFNQVKIVLEK
jgi:hypothetical protein